MKKKLILALSILIVVAGLVFAFNQLKPKPVKGAKSIEITVVNAEEDNKQLYKKTLHTDAETLGKLLDEVKDIEAVTESSTYGRLLVSLVGLNQGDIATGPWWLYESDNNEACKAAGMCMGIDEVVIKDGDRFTFKYTSQY